jgi:hypothetical protein
MATSWFLCPAVVIDFGTPVLRFRSFPKIQTEYYPVIPNPEGVVWEEAETLGHFFVVKVVGPDSELARLRSDSEFFELDPTEVITGGRRNQVRNKFEQLGFTQAEVDATGYTVTGLLALLTTACAIVGRNAGNTGLEVKPGRRVSPKTAAQVEARLPG